MWLRFFHIFINNNLVIFNYIMNTVIEEWLRKPPSYTTFRINKLFGFDIKILEAFLKEQSKNLGLDSIPNFYLLRPDCLVLGQWPDVKLGKTDHQLIVDALCAAAVLRGAHVFAPGVMGLPQDCKLGEKIDIYGDLEKHCKRGLKTNYIGKKEYVGTGHLRMLRKDLFDNGIQPSGIAVETVLPASRLPVVNESIYPKGVVLLQNLPSIVCGWVVNAQKGEIILDMCAAPGNKTTHLAEMSNNEAKIIAIDKTPQKAKKIQVTCEIQGVTCVQAYAFDSTRLCKDDANGMSDGPPFSSESFDKILLDAPCSGLGQRPQLVSKLDLKTLQSYKFLQRKLLSEAVKVLKSGGTLTYSTCTITEDENERNVAWVLEKYPCLELVAAEPLLGGPGLENCGLDNEQRLKVQKFGPEEDQLRPVEHIYRDTIGFFIAKFVKR